MPRIGAVDGGAVTHERGRGSRQRSALAVTLSRVDNLPLTAWDPEPGSALVAGLIYGAVLSVVVLLLPDPFSGWWNLALLIPGWVVVAAGAWFMYAPAKYTLSQSSLARTCRGKTETIPLVEVIQVFGHYQIHVGDAVTVTSRDRGFTFLLGHPGVDHLLERLGPLLVQSGIDKGVIADEKTRRWLGLPDGGRRNPWTPPC